MISLEILWCLIYNSVVWEFLVLWRRTTTTTSAAHLFLFETRPHLQQSAVVHDYVCVFTSDLCDVDNRIEPLYYLRRFLDISPYSCQLFLSCGDRMFSGQSVFNSSYSTTTAMSGAVTHSWWIKRLLAYYLLIVIFFPANHADKRCVNSRMSLFFSFKLACDELNRRSMWNIIVFLIWKNAMRKLIFLHFLSQISLTTFWLYIRA